MRVVGDRAYVADTILGLVVIDLAKPAEPKLLETIATLGGAQDLWVEGDLLYVAVGGEGIELFSLKEPDTPKSLSSVSWDSAVVSVSASGSLVWGVNHESIVAMDASDPNNPVPIATMKTPKWALHVFAKGNIAYVADWTHANVYFLDRSVNAPSSEVSPGTLYFTSGAKEATLNVANRGVAPLQFSGLTVTDPRYSTELSTMEVAPGQSAQVKVKLGAGKEAIDSELCIATNDPAQPVRKVEVAVSSSGSSQALGQQAVDFTLPNVDGQQSHQLSNQLGRVVVLIYFATW